MAVVANRSFEKFRTDRKNNMAYLNQGFIPINLIDETEEMDHTTQVYDCDMTVKSFVNMLRCNWKLIRMFALNLRFKVTTKNGIVVPMMAKLGDVHYKYKDEDGSLQLIVKYN